MIQSTEAIVIASQKYGDSSKIATFFTKDFGIIKAIAKGSLQIKSKFGSALEILSYVQINFYSKPEGHLQLLSDAEIVRPYYNLSKSFEHITIGFALCETIIKTLEENYRNPVIFNELVQSLNNLDKLPANPTNILIKFLLKLTSILGFAINFNSDNNLSQIPLINSKNHKYKLNLESGNFQIKNNNSNNYVDYDLIEEDLMQKIIKINILQIEQIENVQMTINESKRLINLLSKYYHFHLGKYFNIESMRLLTE